MTANGRVTNRIRAAAAGAWSLLPALALLGCVSCSQGPGEWNGEAMEAVREGDLGRAESMLRRGVERYPDEGVLQANLAEVLIRQGRYREALEHQQAAFGKSGAPASVRRLARLEILAKRPGAAAERLERQLGAAGGSPDAPMFGELARAYLAMGEREKASEAIRRGLEAHPGVPELIVFDARLDILGGDLDSARASLTALIGKNPEYAQARLLLGDVNYRQNRFRSAYQEYKTVSRWRDDPRVVLKMGLSLLQAGDAGEAEEALRQAAARSETAEEALLALAVLYVRNPGEAWGDPLERAQQALDSLVDISQFNVAARNLRATVYGMRQQRGRMIAELEASIALDGNQPAVREVLDAYRSAEAAGGVH